MYGCKLSGKRWRHSTLPGKPRVGKKSQHRCSRHGVNGDNFVTVKAPSFEAIPQNSNLARNENRTNHLVSPNSRRFQ